LEHVCKGTLRLERHSETVTAALVETLLARGGDADPAAAEAAADKLDSARPDVADTPAALAVCRLNALATSLGFEGRMKWAEAME
jgi:hypothetical protein